MNLRRREIVKKVREEGRQAALAGKSAQTNPYPNYDSDSFQWWQGFQEIEEERWEAEND